MCWLWHITHKLSTYAFILCCLQYNALKEPSTTKTDESITKYNMKSVFERTLYLCPKNIWNSYFDK